MGAAGSCLAPVDNDLRENAEIPGSPTSKAGIATQESKAGASMASDKTSVDEVSAEQPRDAYESEEEAQDGSKENMSPSYEGDEGGEE